MVEYELCGTNRQMDWANELLRGSSHCYQGGVIWGPSAKLPRNAGSHNTLRNGLSDTFLLCLETGLTEKVEGHGEQLGSAP